MIHCETNVPILFKTVSNYKAKEGVLQVTTNFTARANNHKYNRTINGFGFRIAAKLSRSLAASIGSLSLDNLSSYNKEYGLIGTNPE